MNEDKENETDGEEDNKLIVVSNAEPFTHVYQNGEDEIKTVKRAGGLTTGLDPMMKNSSNLWIAWGRGEADFEVVNEENKVRVPDEEKGYELKRLKLSDDEQEGFYYGFSNETIWPICHSFPHKANLNGDHWEIYKKVNKRYADAVLEEYKEGDRVWVQDYQLALVPKFIRNKEKNAKIALFWHIPWPPWEIFGILPWRKEIVTGLVASDFIGFHTPWLVHNFFDTVEKLGGGEGRQENYVRIGNQEANVKSIPLGIDLDFFSTSEKQKEEARKLKEAFQADTVVLSVDRLDYTKGIDIRVKAIEEFFLRYPKYKGEVTFIKRIAPSRGQVEEYQHMKENIEQLISQVNGKYQQEEWMPIRYFFRHLPQEKLIPYYLAADIGMVTPLVDGMNLVAKEYVATKDRGALVLSEFAGAAETLTEAIQVNPYNTSEVADALKEALETPKVEQEEQFKQMKRKLKMMYVHWWRDRFFDEWELSVHSNRPFEISKDKNMED
mgnify:FL=1